MNDRIVGVEWLAERLGTPGVAVVDVRDAWEYDGIGHVPGAISVPFDTFRADEHGAAEAGMLPGADAFAELMGSAGVAPDDDIVAYDDTHGVFAARLLVTAELYGHDPDRLHLLDGDYSVWNRAEPTTTETPNREPTEYPAEFRVDGPLIERETVENAVGDPDAVIVDTREGWEYEEGHVPGAVRLDWRELVDTDARTIRPESALQELLAERGIHPEKRIVLYCNTARRISHTYTVLRALDYPEVSFYEGSLTEWEREGGALETDE
ncbi:MAG: sulfurtransferase [Natronomonas sp.]|uniref:sulfurtransferase n=1 Tax=Natronomonas sp. TaxID=2184060 RepID=UPI002870A096|nr:sulfurtransferase [Natronomonas sp.]MDR9430015.1 sulfurtransferase [Natronomonas sp.]